MTNTVLIKRSGVADSVPGAGNLSLGELAINYTDGNLFFKNSSNVVTVIASNKFLSVTGNVTGSQFNGSGAGLTSIPGANVTGTLSIPTTSYAATVSGAAQGNITSVGTLSSLSVTGNIISSGNVGVGTSSPVAKLAVVGGTSNASNLATAYSTAAFNITPKSTSGYSLAFGSGPNDRPYIQMSASGTAPNDIMIQPYGGYVGIGTTVNNVYDQVAAQRPLVVQQSDASTTLNGSTAAIAIVNGDTTTNNTAQLNFAAITGASTNQYSSAIISAIFGARTNGQYPTGQLVFSTSTTLNSAPTEKMRIDSSGNVGIGTSSNPGTPVSGRLSVLPASNPTTAATSTTLTLGETTNNSAYQLRMAYSYLSSTYTGVIDAVQNSAGAPLSINPTGGNVGIGTSSPGFKLQVSGAQNANDIVIDNTTINSSLRLQMIDANGGIFTTGSYPLTFGTNNTERMRIDSSGNVSIGTTSTNAKLRISTASTTAYGLISQSPVVGLTAGDYVNMAYFTDTRSSNNDGLRIVNVRDSTGSGTGNWETSSYRIRRSVDQNDGSSGIQEEIVFGANLLAFTTGGSERARIDSGGNFGIGITSMSGAGFLYANTLRLKGSDTFQIYESAASTNLQIGTASGAIIFSPNVTERMRVTSDGQVIIGATSASSSQSKLELKSAPNTAVAIYMRKGDQVEVNMGFSGGGDTNFYINSGSNTLGTSGVYLTNNGTSWSSVSDERTKTIVEPILDAVQKVMTLRAVIGSYKNDKNNARRPFLIAQDVQAVLPEAVNVQDQATGILGMSYTDTIPLLVAAIKEQQVMITALTARVAELEKT